jgi:pimeloyl-ACP methyl ester carboxylesterase
MAAYLHGELGYATLQYDNLGMGFTKLPADNKTKLGVVSCFFSPRTTASDDTWRGPGHVQQLYSLLRELNMLRPPLFLIAHSMGAAVATMFASKYPEHVSGLVLLAPSGLMKLRRFSGIWALRTFVRHITPLSDYFKQKVGKNKTRVNASTLQRSGDFVNAETEEAHNTALQIARQHIHNDNEISILSILMILY